MPRIAPHTASPLAPRAAAPASRWRRPLLAAVRVALLVGAGWALRRELAAVDAHALVRDLTTAGWRALPLALACTAASFLVLGAVERLGLRYAGVARAVPWPATLTTAFVAHAVSQSVGLALLSGAAVRVRGYRRYAVDAIAVARISGFVTLTVALGLLATAGAVLLAGGTAFGVGALMLPARAAGGLLALLAAAYLAWSVFGARHAIGRGAWRVRRPTPGLAGAQLLVSSLDWLLTAAVLFALMPPAVGVGYAALLRAYLVSQTAGMLSHVPGGYGVFELAMLALLPSPDPATRAAVVAGVLLFRVVYYLLPLVAALLVGGVTELRSTLARRPAALAAAGARGAR